MIWEAHSNYYTFVDLTFALSTKPLMITFLKLSENKNMPYIEMFSHSDQIDKSCDCLKLYREQFKVTLITF